MYHCPELCCVYCENDDISFSGLLPKIRFERTGTLAKWFALLRFSFSRSEVKPMMKNYLLLMYIDLTQRATQLEKVRVIDR